MFWFLDTLINDEFIGSSFFFTLMLAKQSTLSNNDRKLNEEIID